MPDCTYGIKAEVIAKLCGVDTTTARRWKSGLSRVPFAAAALLQGDLSAFSGAWKGWRIEGEAIVSPEGLRISPNDALAVPLLLGQIDALRSELAYLKTCSELDNQPLPGEVPDMIAVTNASRGNTP